jgi:hypothetical protein
MALVMTMRGQPWNNVPAGQAVEEGWVCACLNYCVAGNVHGSPVWNPALTLIPSDSTVHAAISGAVSLLQFYTQPHYKRNATGRPA